jgi:oxygen-independent coproporphyrinogen-3 oxidase
MRAAIPLSVYVHFPWCVSKCPYCDFNSYALREALPEAAYLDALARDLDAQLAHPVARAAGVDARPVASVFLGGGTPSLFAPDAIGRVLAMLRGRLRVDADAEITLEANPATIERGRFAQYAAAGVNRVSLGGQSFDAGALRRLGRIHAPQDTRRAAEELHAVGLANFNVDLMYGLPGHDPEAALRDVESALALSPAHVSHYSLTLEPGTPFAATPPTDLPGEDAVAESLRICQAALRAAGFERYEVSAYARPGRRAAHNLNYWRFGDYLGIGAGAHGKLTAPGGAVHRTTWPREPRRYFAATGAATGPVVAAVEPSQLPFEFMLNTLRLLEGGTRTAFVERTGLDWRLAHDPLRALARRGLVTLDGERFAATATGLDFLNELLLAFLPGPATHDCRDSQLRGMDR